MILLVLAIIWAFGFVVLTGLAIQDEKESQNEKPIIIASLCLLFWPLVLGSIIVTDIFRKVMHEIYRKA